jgi:hypothetical protein
MVIRMMKYQLVLQLPASSVEDYDELTELEEILIEGLGDLGNVDGHDAGSGEMNIFLLTDDPQRTFERIKSLPGTRNFMADLKVAFRKIGHDKFTILHPMGLTHFAIA